MNGKFLLDTNIVIAIFANDKSVMTSLVDASEVFVPNITIGELYYGAYKSNRFEFNISRIDEFASNSSVIGCHNDKLKLTPCDNLKLTPLYS